MPIFEWISNHAHLLGWGTVVTLSIKFIRFLTKAEARVLQAEKILTKMATNDIVHIEASMERSEKSMSGIHEEVKGLREDVKDFLIAAIKK